MKRCDGPIFNSEAWARCTEDFLASIEDISGSKNSRSGYAQRLRGFFTDQARAPDTYSSSEVKAYLQAPSTSQRNYGAAIKPQTRNARLTALNSFYKWAADYEVDGVPLLTVKAPTFGVRFVKAPPSPRAMTERELALLMGTVTDDTERSARDRAMFLVFWWTGRRLSEVQRLTWGDLEESIVCDVDGTRRNAIVFHFVAKGKSRTVQTAELPAPAHHALLHYLRIAGRLDSMQPDSPLFVSTRARDKGKTPLNRMRINEIFHERCKQAGISPAYSVHSLRHTAAAMRYSQGADIITLKEWLGHSSLETTFRYVNSIAAKSDAFALQLEQQFAFLAK